MSYEISKKPEINENEIIEEEAIEGNTLDNKLVNNEEIVQENEAVKKESEIEPKLEKKEVEQSIEKIHQLVDEVYKILPTEDLLLHHFKNGEPQTRVQCANLLALKSELDSRKKEWKSYFDNNRYNHGGNDGYSKTFDFPSSETIEFLMRYLYTTSGSPSESSEYPKFLTSKMEELLNQVRSLEQQL